MTQTTKEIIAELQKVFDKQPDRDKCATIEEVKSQLSGDAQYNELMSHFGCSNDAASEPAEKGPGKIKGLTAEGLFGTFTIIQVVLVLGCIVKVVSVSYTFAACEGSTSTARKLLMGMVASICVVGMMVGAGWKTPAMVSMVVLAVFMTVVTVYFYAAGCDEWKVDVGDDNATSQAKTVFISAVVIDLVMYVGCGVFFYMRM